MFVCVFSDNTKNKKSADWWQHAKTTGPESKSLAFSKAFQS